MKLIQRLTYILSLIIAGINFIYTLAFSSNWARGAARLGDFYTHAQEVNHLIFQLALYGVIFTSLALILNTHKNRKFYVTNYLLSGLSSVMFIVMGIVTMLKITPLKAEYLLLDPEQLAFVTTVNWSTPGGTVFNWWYGISVAMLIAALFILFVTGDKFIKHVLRASIEKKHLEVNHDHS